ncbi:hypothetical protein [Deinococcus petrolearius]|uniref:Lipoprotein n=1 Tax=Deinococcus petrolearius TaxID=1751295 RepID=A0ABW1DQZ1_9DEIO
MKKLALIIPAISIALASCGVERPTSTAYTLVRPANVQSLAPVYNPAGTLSVGQVPGVTRTTLTLTGLAPYGIYVARYFTPGAAAMPAATAPVAPAPAAAASSTVTNPATATAGTSAGGAISGGTLAQTQAAGTTSATDPAAMPMGTPAPMANPGGACSGGTAIAASQLIGQADKDGKLSLDSFLPTAALSGAAYLNVQGASNFMGTPSDSGVLCAAVDLG